jgi:SAM-dependent methyltransferase
MYNELASWWPLLSPPSHYVEEANFYIQTFKRNRQSAPQTMLELGSGGGSNAFHMKQHFTLTLVDLSAQMLAVSRAINPECDHRQGDMRTVRLNQIFDAVFVHDAVIYMLNEDDLRKALETAYLHCRAGGVALFVPDYVKENFAPHTKHGGEDGQSRSLRYLEWIYDPDPNDSTYVSDYAYLLREGDSVRVEHDRHLAGLFSRNVWLRLLSKVGFEAEMILDPWDRDIFLARKP